MESNIMKTEEFRSRGLVCSCNDNSHCATPHYRENKKHRNMGNCTVYSDGRCYAARVINLDALERYLRSQVKTSAGSFVNASKSLNTFSANLNKFIRLVYGCFNSHDKTTLSCNSYLTKHAVPQAIECCNSSNMCNLHLFPKFIHHETDSDAVRTAINHYERTSLWRKETVTNENIRLKPYMNVGPDMLIGGSAVGNLPHNKLRMHALWKDQVNSDSRMQYLFQVVLISTFSLVFIVLSVVFATVCCVYKRRKQKTKLRLSTTNIGSSSILKLPELSTVCDSKSLKIISNRELKFMHSTSVKFEKLCKTKDGSSPHTLLTDLTHNFDSETIVNRGSENLLSRGELLHLIPQTIGRQITLENLLGTGRFSDVWSGTWKGERVVAKLFRPDSRITCSIWRRTVLLHRSVLLRHQRVHGLMGVDWLNYPTEAHLSTLKQCFKEISLTVSSPCALLVGEACVYGTLKDFLSNGDWIVDFPNYSGDNMYLTNCDVTSYQKCPFSTLNSPDGIRLRILLQITNSLVQGLCFLHSEFAGTRGKPALAHRDLKPSNIYVRSDWSCCIGDIGLSVRLPSCPFPLPADQLHKLYQYYEDCTAKYLHLDNRSIGVATFEQVSVSPFDCRSLYTSQTKRLEPIGHKSQLNESCNQITGLLDKWNFDKLELLEWWPVGGIQIGTPRYMAPELLSKSINPFCFESYQKSDIYALALILWEVVNWALPESIWPGQTVSDCLFSRRRSSSDSMSLSYSDSSFVSKVQDNKYCPVYQNEWLHLIKCTMNNGESNYTKSYSNSQPCQFTSCNHASEHSIKSKCMPTMDISQRLMNELSLDDQLKNKEPDLGTIYYLVCKQQLRPRIPTSFPMNITNETKIKDDYSHQNIQSFCEILTKNLIQLHNNTTIYDNNTDIYRVNKLTSAICREYSSSGASSLQSNHTDLNFNDKESSNPNQLRFVKLQYLVACHFAMILPECWVAEPDSRLSALRIKKRLQRIYDLINDLMNKSSSEFTSSLTDKKLNEISNCSETNVLCTNGMSTLVNRT
ncbi:Bone morphogenetic protein receptor type-1A isoform 1 [Schistosoma japonicum]|uniref:receptor protein serine/threonine kinase n=2 Tax=Schistosoma japonicum TaxID=6182 RepID=A0A4Z2D830_SCHJA|nr:Bone morphogenetic protein receptor type-1A isoform 1 [Schistosoma japonicum]